MSDIENIPAEMKEHDIFCCWKEEMRNGKKTKVPYNARTGSRASSNDLSAFSSYGEAIKVMHDYDGIGFIVSHDICAIDLDGCFNEAGELNEIAQNVIAYFPHCYIEKSPSGSELHIYFKAANFDYDTDIYYINNRKLNIEVYIAGVTNHFLQLVKRHTEISAICPELIREFVDKINVYQAEKVNGKQELCIKIYYNCIGVINNIPNV